MKTIKLFLTIILFSLIFTSCDETCINLRLEYSSLKKSYDSLLLVTPDTVWMDYNCTLYYDRIDSINGEQYYVGYDGIYYKLFQDYDTLIRQVFINWIDTTIIQHRFLDSTIYIDSIVTGDMGELVLWASIICQDHLNCGDCGTTKLVLGDVLYGSTEDAEDLSAIVIEGYSTVCDGEYGLLSFHINGSTEDILGIQEQTGYFPMDNQNINKYSFTIHKDFDEINEITLEFVNDCWIPDLNEDLNIYISSIKINNREYLTSEYVTLDGDAVYWEEDGSVTMRTNGFIVINL